MEPSPTIFPNSRFVIHGWGPSAEEGTGATAAGGGEEQSQRRTQNGRAPSLHKPECKFLRPRKTPPRALSANKSPRGGRSLHHCSLCQHHLLGVSRESRRLIFSPRLQKPTGAQWTSSAPGQAGLSFSPLVPPALFTSIISRTPERSMRRWLRARGGGGGGKYRSLA